MEVNLLTDNLEINTIINLIENKYQTNTFIENLCRYILKKNGLEINNDLDKICKLNQFLFNIFIIFLGIPSLNIIKSDDIIYKNESLLQLSILIIINRVSISYYKLLSNILGDYTRYEYLVREIELYDWDIINYEELIRLVFKNFIKGVYLFINHKKDIDIQELTEKKLNNLVLYFKENNNNFESLDL
jgi:hypothetical protein